MAIKSTRNPKNKSQRNPYANYDTKKRLHFCTLQNCIHVYTIQANQSMIVLYRFEQIENNEIHLKEMGIQKKEKIEIRKRMN